MIERRVIINLVVFLGLTAVLVAYGWSTLVRNPLDHRTILYAYVDDTGGVRSGFTVALRGVPVGHVASIDGVASRGGAKVRVTLAIDGGVAVPADAQAQIERANPLGEQQVDLIPMAGDAAPPARRGAVLATSATPAPPDLGRIVDAADRLFAAVPTDDLETVVHELALALNGRAQDLRTIIESADVVARTNVSYETAFRTLLASAPPVLDTLSAVGPELQRSLVNTALLVDLLDRRKTDIVNLLHTGTAFASAANTVLDDNIANLACLAHDLGDLGANLGATPQYRNLDTTLLQNQAFFGPIIAISPVGHAASLGPGSPERNNQTWLRVRTLLPPQQPFAAFYSPPHQIPDTYPGAACVSVFGPGVGAAAQVDPAPPQENGKVIPAPVPAAPVEQQPGPTPEGGGTRPGNVFAPAARGTAAASAQPAGPAPPAHPAQTTQPARPAQPAQPTRVGTQPTGPTGSAAPVHPTATTAPPRPAAPPPGHPETALLVGGGILGLGALERREVARLGRRRPRTHPARRPTGRAGR